MENKTAAKSNLSIEILAKQVVEGFITGLHKSPFHGFSVEFAEHRHYNQGESTKHVDWKLFGRTEKLFTKKYDEETNLRCQIVIDCSSSMYFKTERTSSKIEYAILAAASLIELLKKQRDGIGLTFISSKIELHTAAKSSMQHQQYLFNELEKKRQPFDKKAESNLTNLAYCIHEIAELSHRRSLVFIFTDLLDDPSKTNTLIESLNHLKHNKHEVVLFNVMDKNLELDFNFSNQPLHLIDMESGEELKLSPASFKEKYTTEINAFYEKIALSCSQYKIDFVSIDTNEPLIPVLQKYLIKRKKTA